MGARVVDLMYAGFDRVIAAHEIDGAVVDCGPANCQERLLDELEAEPEALLLTHIHLDHAGGTGALVERFPDLRVYVHELGAPHLVDPSRLLRSAARLYGEENMDDLWGEVVPVPQRNITALQGGERIEGAFEVAHTPGHASHHVCFLHEESGDAYVGDVAGVRAPPADFVLAPTPPPEIDVEAWLTSIDIVESWMPQALCLTHCGRFTDVSEHLGRMRERLGAWSELARGSDEASFLRQLNADIDAGVDPDTADRLKRAAPPEQLWLGLERYWAKRDEAENAA